MLATVCFAQNSIPVYDLSTDEGFTKEFTCIELKYHQRVTKHTQGLYYLE
jgi:hypothetical protein